MDTAFHTKLEHDDLAWTVVCGGELDVATAMRLEEAFDLCEQMLPRSIHIDARDVTFIDSTGITSLIHCAHRCNEEGIGFSLDPSEQVRAILHEAGIAERLLLGRPSAPTPA
ncbi:MAG: STAS domain-containing protein [Actinomycetota bacterium]